MHITLTSPNDLCEAENVLMMMDAAIRYCSFDHSFARNARKAVADAIAEYKAEVARQKGLFEEEDSE